MIIWDIFKAFRIKARYKLLKFHTVDDMPVGLHGDYEHGTMTCRINSFYGEWDRHWTGYHEFLHAISDAYDIKLTEDQVSKLERAHANLYRYNLGFTLDPPCRKK